MELLIKNAKIVDAFQSFEGDIYIENGKIKEIGLDLNKANIEIIDAKNMTLMPAFIDTHAHFREPGFTQKEDIKTGSMAAAKGGYTTVCLMANTSPVCSTKDVLETILSKAKEVDLVNVIQTISITKGFDGKNIEHLEEFYGDNRVKTISDDGKGVMNSEVMMRAMKVAKDNNWVLMSHAEDSEFSSTDMRVAENIMTLRDLYLAKETGARLHMAHVSTKEAIEYITRAKNSGVNVTCEVTPHHIGLTNDISNYRVNPPIREKEDVQSIIDGIRMGIVDCIGTDHAPHTTEDKAKGAPGMVGLETAFSICYTTLVKENNLSLKELSKLMSYNPSKILGLNKGIISIGQDADLVLLDLDKKIKVDSKTFASKGKNTPFEGREYQGDIALTIKSGKVVYNRGI